MNSYVKAYMLKKTIQLGFDIFMSITEEWNRQILGGVIKEEDELKKVD